jgi:hypothetical protein
MRRREGADGLQRSTGARAGVALLAALAVSSTAAHAGEVASHAADPHYAVAPECPSRDVFSRALHARLPANLRSYALANELSVSIVREPDAGGRASYAGQLGALATLPEAGRRVRGESCDEVLEALTLIAALSVEQLAASEPAEPAPVLHAVQDDAAVDAAPAPAVEAGQRPRIGPAAFVLVQNTSAPGLAVDLGAGAVSSWDRHPLSPWLLVGGYWGGGEQSNVAAAGVSARFERAALYATGCVWRFPRSGPLALRPCLELDVGALRGEGLGVGSATRRTALWLSSGASVRGSVSLSDRIELGAQVGGMLPLYRPRFYFLPGVTAFQVEPVGFRAGSFVSLLF